MQMSEYTFGDDLRQRVEANIKGFDAHTATVEGLRHAGVIIVVVKTLDSDEAGVLLTFRPPNMRRHAGQYSLPGGRMDEGETVADTALRELHEELGMELDPACIIGPLDDFVTRSGFVMSPLVAWGGANPALTPDPVEVARVERIPFSELDRPELPYLEPSDGEHPVMSAPLPTLGHHLFAPTAALLYQFREVALRGLSTRVAHFDQPHFARK
jgi:8-oxo-dGTP pyrophosphatase MutT (NUDIX family)